ncbi:MAG: polysaccharide pyruvyl transferase family protein, partial [Anaerolineae bacterium]|nr:polysaccharide pyruvyl transferase family protein [Anaerolineae bacterium]
MNIGVIGWWHQDNQGDSAILASLRQALAPPHQLVPIDTAFDITPDELYRLNRLDFLILGGGGLFQQAPPRPFDTFEVWGEQLQTPIGIVGLGVDTVRPQHHAAVRTLVEQAQFFYVRDRASQQALDHPKVLVSPDLTFAYPLTLPARSRPPAQQLPICGINLRKSPGLDTKQWVEVLQALPVQLRGIPFSSFGSWEELQILQSLDKQCAAAFTPTLYDGLDLMIATAFHSVVFA